ncbi:hypothetical protein SAMN05661096_02166 [Marivirga sericea]|uniref:Uncharacterized protein n=1 Tax=Marivirga sericea TaxID=1028 RepID=A0A1X7K018_9BACT|nr:hypothetical protein [Marivirga sericea]SMG33821.1 hypothetical protein SAMN05661096_02166 [Marivirga sericea]
MEAKTLENKNSSIQANDWIPAKSFYSCKNGICNSCLSRHENRKQLVLPLSKLKEPNFKIDLGNFLKSLAKFDRPVLFYHSEHPIQEQVLIKFTGHENFESSFKVVQPFLPKTIIPATIISPYALSKNNRLKEHKLVSLTKRFFQPLGFIKLHLHSVADYHEYADSEKVGLLMMPLKDLPDYIQYAMNSEDLDNVIPAIFQP